MEHWMNVVKRKIVELENADRLIFRFGDFRYTGEYITTGKGMRGECVEYKGNFRNINEEISDKADYLEWQESQVSKSQKEKISKSWGQTASHMTDWDYHTIDSFTYYDILRKYQDVRKMTKDKNERKKLLCVELGINKDDLDKIIQVLSNTKLKDYLAVVIKYKNLDFDINDGKFVDLLAEAIAFAYNTRRPPVKYGSHLMGLKWDPDYKLSEAAFRTYSMIVYFNPKYFNRGYGAWGYITQKPTDDLILGVQVLVPKIQQLRRVIVDMLQATEDHPYSRCPVYNLNGKLVWPTKEELSQTY